MSKQKLHIQRESFKNLKFFTKSDSNLTYEFDENITLSFYNLNYPAKDINKTKLIYTRLYVNILKKLVLIIKNLTKFMI